MPFKLKLKKSRQYNVSSKNLFVISVELLDNTTVECTLSSQSIGQECLHNVCQRLGLQQPQYFGLRFLSKKGTYWWIDLQRPLKKQLDKYAQENASLSLGVMYYVSDVNILHDEVTRYHYFLQLKSDIIEGKLHCNEDQTILFASYSLQAEFGDHDPERHTTEYLTNFGLLPKHVARGKENQEAILEQVIHTHRSLQGLSQQLAEVYYIMEAQHLEGYGQECFAGKDSSSTALFVGISLIGIFIRYMNDQPPLSFQWSQIINLVHHKRCFGIECHNSTKVIQTFMDDSHLAKYVWKTCIQQHRFYTKNEGLISPPKLPDPPTENRKITNLPRNAANSVPSLPQYKTEQTGSKSQLQESQDSLDGLGVYHTEGGYSELVSPSAIYGQMLLQEEQLSPPIPPHRNLPLTCSTPLASSVPTLQTAYSHPLPLNTLPTSSSATQLHQASDPSLYQPHQLNHVEPRNEVHDETKCTVLPIYRQAPDYDTAVKLKYGIQSCSAGDMSPSSPLIQSQNTAAMRGQIDISQVFPNQHVIPLQSYAQYKNYHDLSHLEVNEIPREGSEPFMSIRNYEHASAPSLHPPIHTYSSPELASQDMMRDVSTEQMIANMHMMYQFKPPPPYPYKQRSSSSTPDLTRNHQQPLPANSSPDLVSRKSLGGIPLVGSQMLDCNSGYQLGSQPLCFDQENLNIPDHFQHQGFDLNSAIQSGEVPNPYDPSSANFTKLAPNNVNHQNLVTTQNLGIQNCLPAHTYQNYNPVAMPVSVVQSSARHISEPAFSTVMTAQSTEVPFVEPASQTVTPPKQFLSTSTTQPGAWSKISTESVLQAYPLDEASPRKTADFPVEEESQTMGPMLVAAMNGLTLSRPDIVAPLMEERFPKDSRIQALESRLLEGQVFLEFERIIKKKPMADFTTALLPENIPRNRFKDVFPYEENRVRLTPTSENKTGYINASHLSATVGGMQRFYIAAQGPLPNTLYSFWQMIWEHRVSVIVMLTEVQEQGRDKCFPYWPQEDNNKLQIGEFQIVRNFSMSSPTYVTCSLTLCHVTSHQQRSLWHIQYTDWPDHSCPQDVQGFITFMTEVDAVRRHALSQQPQGMQTTSPVVVHCSAGVGRSGAVILCDIMLFALDHNQPLDIPKVLTQLRLQRMLTIQTLAQYKFVYTVLVQYLRNSRLI